MDVSALLQEIRNDLDITWEDPLTDEKLTGIIKRGISFLVDRTGAAETDFTENSRAKALLFDYVRYDRSAALNEFYENYASELNSLMIANEVDNAAENQEEGGTV